MWAQQYMIATGQAAGVRQGAGRRSGEAVVGRTDARLAEAEPYVQCAVLTVGSTSMRVPAASATSPHHARVSSGTPR